MSLQQCCNFFTAANAHQSRRCHQRSGADLYSASACSSALLVKGKSVQCGDLGKTSNPSTAQDLWLRSHACPLLLPPHRLAPSSCLGKIPDYAQLHAMYYIYNLNVHKHISGHSGVEASAISRVITEGNWMYHN